MALRNPWLPASGYARSSGAVAALLLAIGAGGLFAGTRLGTVLGLCAATLALIPAFLVHVFLSRARREGRRIRELADEDCLAHWTYDSGTWELHLNRLRREGGRLPILFGGLVGVSGLIPGLILLGDGERLSGSVLLTIAVPLAITCGTGLAVGVLVRLGWESILRRMAEEPGEAWIGRTGFYVTGEFLPREGGDLAFDGLEAREEDDRLVLVVRYRTRGTRQQGVGSFLIPVPRGEEESARRIARRYSGN